MDESLREQNNVEIERCECPVKCFGLYQCCYLSVKLLTFTQTLKLIFLNNLTKNWIDNLISQISS
jgi:hypothetical protein